jgi:hypothetical protein
MPISPSASTGFKGSTSGAQYINSAHANATASLSVPASGALVTVVTNVYRTQVSVTDLMSAVTLGGVAMTLAKRVRYQRGANDCIETCIWYAMNVTSGAKTIALDFVNETLDNLCSWHGDSWAGVATTSALDVTAENGTANPHSGSFAVPASGASATLAQATELVIAVITAKWSWMWNGAYDPNGGTPPSTYTFLAGRNQDNVNELPFQSVYKETSSTTGVSAAWTLEATDSTVAALATFKIGTTQRRVKVLADSSINNATGITAFAWSGDPSSVLAQKWTSRTAEASGGIVYLPTPPAAWTTGAEVNVVLYQPAGDKKTTGFVVGKVEEY